MKESPAPAVTYASNVVSCDERLNALQRKRNRLGWARLSMIIFPAGLIYLFLPGQLLLFLAGMIVVVIFFLWLVVKDLNNDQEISYLEYLRKVNLSELQIMQGDYGNQYDGKNLEIPEHAYAADLDIFGKFSLFQYVNRCTSEQGRALLARRFQHPLELKNISEYQYAVKEMSTTTAWRQQWQAIGMAEGFSLDTENKITQWLELSEDHTSTIWNILLYIFPVISVGTLLFFLSGYIPFSLFIFLMIAYFYFSGFKVKAVNASHGYLSRILPEVNSLYKQLHHFERSNWSDPLINRYKSAITQEAHSAGAAFYQLKQLLNRFDMRLNLLVNPLLNIFFLWDIRQLIALLAWKKKNKTNVALWINAMAETDLLVSLSTFAYNHDSFCFPDVVDDYFHFNATGLGHPLIDENKRVVNDTVLNGTGQIMLITGSNMAGKSTFLRSVGINTVLAMMGSPVCATAFSMSHVQVISSMRIADNLAENTSTFYAELKKLKTIIDNVNQGTRMLILMDEILRGTNSIDRHAGSEALIEQMIRQDAVAILATHDVELGSLATKYPAAIHNYHFDVQVKGEELFFDFKLKDGICQSMNASILMRKIGIQM